MENPWTDFLSQQYLNLEDWSLNSKSCYTDKGCWIDNLVPERFNSLDRFESRFKDSLAEAVDVVQWYWVYPNLYFSSSTLLD